MKQKEVHIALSGRIRLTLFLLALITAGFFGSKAMPRVVAAVNGNTERKLPIYCVDTQDKKVSLSFDAAWGV